MKLTLDIKNASRAITPQKGDVIIYDNDKWYVTTKEELLKESLNLIKECQEEIKQMRQLSTDLKIEVATQLLKMSELVKKMYSK